VVNAEWRSRFVAQQPSDFHPLSDATSIHPGPQPTQTGDGQHHWFTRRHWKGANVRSIWEAQPYWFGVTLLIMMAVTSHAAADGMNSALLSSVYGSMRMARLKKHRLNVSRGIAMALNALALTAAMIRVDAVGMYAVVTTIAGCLACPLFLSVCFERFFALASGQHILLSTLSGLVACSAYGMVGVRRASNGRLSGCQVMLQGLKRAFYNNYDWRYLLLSLLVPLAVYACCIWRSSVSRAAALVTPKHWPNNQHHTAASARPDHAPLTKA
jgi:Na+/proline symporter